VDTLASLGVPDVVATRWQIDSTSAVPMMDAFYGGLARGLSVPQALTAARSPLSATFAIGILTTGPLTMPRAGATRFKPGLSRRPIACHDRCLGLAPETRDLPPTCSGSP